MVHEDDIATSKKYGSVWGVCEIRILYAFLVFKDALI